MSKEKLYRLRYNVPVSRTLNRNGFIANVRDFTRLDSAENAILQYKAKGWEVVNILEYELIRERKV